MIRADMISTVGRKYLTSNIENDEYSYPKAFSAASLPFVPVRNNNGRAFEKLDDASFNKYIALFICAILRKEKYRYSYGRKWVLESMRSTVIKLPATVTSKPDYMFMESYMKSLPYGDRI